MRADEARTSILAARRSEDDLSKESSSVAAPTTSQVVPRVKKLLRNNMRSAERARRAWELKRAGASFTEIEAAIGVSRTQAWRYVHAELDRLRAETYADAEAYRIEEIERTSFVVREAVKVIAQQCRGCGGKGVFQDPALEGTTGLETVCEYCGGSGLRYGVSARLQAADRILRAVDTRAKLLGLYAPQSHRIVDEEGNDRSLFYADLAKLDDAELERELAALLESVHTVEGDEASGNGVPPFSI